ncbi:MAG: hypothetical protein CR988_05335 [Treponema sp.]|nr:MAG: hypothetical protein CR988_05335 [Treponema sp.]
MPNVDELKKIKAELRVIGDEPRILKEWGEEYVDIPLPAVSMPDVDIDDLLGSIDVENNNPEEDILNSVLNDPQMQESEAFSPEAFAGLTETDDTASAVTPEADIPKTNVSDTEEDLKSPDSLTASSDDTSEIQEPNSVDELSALLDNAEPFVDEPKVIAPEIEDEVPASEAPVPDELGAQDDNFDNLLSDLNFDDAVAEESLDSNAPEMPENMLTEEVDLAEFTGDSLPDSQPAEDIAADNIIENASDSNLNENLDFSGDNKPEAETEQAADSGFEEINLDDIQMPDVSDPMADNFEFEETASDMPDSGVLDEMPSSILDEDALSGQPGDEGSIEDTGAALEDLALSNDSFDENMPTPLSEFNLDSSSDEPSDIGSLIGETEPEEDPYKPVEDISNLDVNMPEIDETTGFAKKSDGTGSLSDGFQVPENFADFSDDDYRSFQPKEESGETAKMDSSGKIPLEISEKDFQFFLKRLSLFPLNVRKEIQNYLANEKDSEVNKMELVNLVVKNSSLKKIAQDLETKLKKSIRIPKDFERKNALEYEREKKTFKYRLMHQIIPIASIATVIFLFLASVGVLIWHFAYKPLMAERFYKDGIYYIENAKYNTAINRFDKAGTYWKKRRWYFKYADELKKRKQYGSAEAIYLRLLYDFDRDVEGGIAYAQMVANDLRDYEKAETILKRQILDFHINNPDALVALGNIYLDWGDEVEEKYEEAAKIFSNLLKEDPYSDVYNAGMMKYYIRTDNLAKVLPLKDYFLRKNAKISAEDLTELGTYLLEKRYNPKPSDDLELRAAIDDVREILEKSYQMHPESPEANYNLGRFFLYNYKPTEAKFYLKGAIKAYSDIIRLSPRRFIKKIDSMRLYGEILLSENKEIEAEQIFSNAMSFYKEYVEIGELPPNEIVGKLFEDYGNIKYFIANDYELALDAYSNAVRQLNDTPSIYYKLGFINYKLGNYPASIKNMSLAYMKKPDDQNLLFALGNVLFRRGDYYAAQAYYERLMENLESERLRKGILFPQIRTDHGEFVQRYMKGANNLGVVLNRLANRTGDSVKNARAFALFEEASRAWDALTRNPETMIRVKNEKSGAYVNVQYMTVPDRSFIPEIYSEIPKTLVGEEILKQKQDK